MQPQPTKTKESPKHLQNSYKSLVSDRYLFPTIYLDRFPFARQLVELRVIQNGSRKVPNDISSLELENGSDQSFC